MNLVALLVSAVLELLNAEDPTMATRAPERMAQFQASVKELVPIHVEVGRRGVLVSPAVDPLILASVNYAETRFRLPAPSGDCKRTHKYAGVPSLRWPKGYVPVMKWICPSVGPMNVAQDNRRVVGQWSEVVEVLPGIQETPLTSKDMEDLATNIKLAYGILHHWKNECRNRNEFASVASWLTAYRWGRCTPQHWNRRYFDGEAKRRCARIDAMIAHTKVPVPEGWSCKPSG